MGSLEEALAAHERTESLTAEDAEGAEEDLMNSTREREREGICDELIGRLW